MYDCIKDTATSKKTIKINKPKGIKARTAIIKLLQNALNKKLAKIPNNTWPATKLQNNLKPKEIALEQ